MTGPWEKYQTPATPPATPPAATPDAEGPWSKYGAPSAPSDGWQDTPYGFKVKPIQIGQVQTVQRPDGAAWFGPEQGNKGQPGWFNAQGQRMADKPTPEGAPSQPWMSQNLGTIIGPSASIAQSLAHRLMGDRGTNPTVGGVAHGVASDVVAPAQLAAHAVSSSAVDPLANRMEAYFGTGDKGGQMLGQAAPFLMTGGASAAGGPPAAGAETLSAAQKIKAILGTIGKGAATGAIAAPAMTTETNVQSPEDYWARKASEAKMGAATGGILASVPVVAEGIGALASKAKMAGATPSPGEMLDQLGTRLGGKAPGEALQSAAQAKYDAGWDAFKKAVAPVDEQAGSVGVDYSPAIQNLQELLGIGGKRSPNPIPPERRQVLEELLGNLQEAMKPEGQVDNSFQGAIDTIKSLGSIQRQLAIKHGDTEARAMLGSVRDSILQSMEQSNPELAAKAAEARKVFATQVAPLFDKSQGGQLLTKIRDTATPGDLLGAQNQGALTRIKPDAARIIAQGSSADPLLYSYLDAAIKQADGKPGSFAASIQKAMPAIEAIAGPEDLKAFQGMAKVAKTSKFGGMLANIGMGAALGHGGHEVMGPAATLAASFNPAMTGPGLMWKLLQSPGTRHLLTLAGNLAEGSPELELIGRDMSKRIAAMSAVTSAKTTPGMIPAMASKPTPSDTEVAQMEPK